MQHVRSAEWSVRVDGVEVPSETEEVGFIQYDVRFRLPSGQAATARLRHVVGLRVWELCTGDRAVLYPGKRGFRCPSCRNSVESYATACGSCGAPQPSNHARVNAWLRSSVARSVALTNLLFVLIGIQTIAMYRKGAGAAFASLQRTRIEAHFPGQFDTSTAAGFQAGSLALLQTQLTGLAACMMLMFGVALLAYRAPVTAASVKLVVVASLFLAALFTLPHVSAVLYVFFALLTWSALVTLKAATTLRARDRVSGSAL